jgi:hypothetical protein
MNFLVASRDDWPGVFRRRDVFVAVGGGEIYGFNVRLTGQWSLPMMSA